MRLKSKVTSGKSKPSLVATFVALLLISSAAISAPVTVIATGVIYEYENTTGSFSFGVVMPDVTRFTLNFLLDLSVPDLIPDDPTFGRYWNSISSMSLTINGNTKLMPGLGETIVHDSWFAEGTGAYQELISSIVRSGDPLGIWESMFLVASDTSFSPQSRPPLESDALVPTFMSEFWSEGIDYFIEDRSGATWVRQASLRGSVESIQVVPAPPALWLLSSALGLIGWIRRKEA